MISFKTRAEVTTHVPPNSPRLRSLLEYPRDFILELAASIRLDGIARVLIRGIVLDIYTNGTSELQYVSQDGILKRSSSDTGTIER